MGVMYETTIKIASASIPHYQMPHILHGHPVVGDHQLFANPLLLLLNIDDEIRNILKVMA